jgi:phosphoglycolate phosphatase
MVIEHIIWDWNGTLYDDALACVNTLNVILERRGLRLVDLDQYREIFRFPVKRYYEILGFDFEVEDWAAMAKEFHAIYAEESQKMRLRDGIENILDQFLAVGMPMSVLSAAETGSLEKLLREYGVRDYFDRVQGLSDIYAGSKVEAGGKLLEQIPESVDGVLLIGDTTHDYEVAVELGCTCALLCDGHQAQHRLEQCDCAVFSDIRELVLEYPPLRS